MRIAAVSMESIPGTDTRLPRSCIPLRAPFDPETTVLTWFRNRGNDRRKAKQLYGAVVTQARQPMFYSGLGVPDTPEGRYEMIVLHLYLLMERLRAEGEPAVKLNRHLVEAFVEDMDDSMREMGVGDLTVPKKVKRAAAGYYERAGEYRAGLEAPAGSGGLGSALARNIWPRADATPAEAELLAAYVRSTAADLAPQTSSRLLAGEVVFPPVVFVDL